MKLHLRPRSAKHREEAARLGATTLNGVAIACLIGATFGPWLNPALIWGWSSMALLLAGIAIHAFAQIVLSLGYEEDRNVT